MSGSKPMKQTSRRKNKFSVSTIGSLPKELVTEVFARVAASSFTDYLNVKSSCKVLNELAEDSCILQQVSLERFPVITWHINNHVASFLERCKESGSPEALYRQGVVEYFSSMKTESGFECLKRAAKSGHLEASYVLGMLLICRGEEMEQQQGIEILNNMMLLKVTTDCRKKFKAVRDLMWPVKKLDSEPKFNICTRHRLMKFGHGWDSIDCEDDELLCQDCRYDREIYIFRNMLR